MSPQIHNFRQDLPPFCPECNVLLVARPSAPETISAVQCPKCREVFGRHSVSWLPADEDLTLMFDQAIECLKAQGYSFDEASGLLREYFSRFTSAKYCAEMHVPLQDADSFHHDGPFGVALRAHYCVRLGMPPDYGSFVEWRTTAQRLERWPT